MMEKRGVLEDGMTPPEKPGKDLEDHLTKRAADTVAGGITRDSLHDAMKLMPKLGRNAQSPE